MKYSYFVMVIALLTSNIDLFGQTSQNTKRGLEAIIVEKYYVSDAKDAESKTGGHLPVGSVTYRVYVDMLPGYRFQAAYGIPGHELQIATTTKFFNNEDWGGIIANVIPFRNLKDNTVMLDSWLSAGAGSDGTIGVPKADDNEAGTIINADGILQHSDPSAGIPIKMRDGLSAGTPARVTAFGIDTMLAIFNKQTASGIFSTTNGSWACLGGSAGRDSTSNKVLIGQFTTDGVFTFELNIQIGTPYGGVENYVAKDPQGIEIILPSLVYSSSLKSGPVTKKNQKK
jgi:hypothetical protein